MLVCVYGVIDDVDIMGSASDCDDYLRCWDDSTHFCWSLLETVNSTGCRETTCVLINPYSRTTMPLPPTFKIVWCVLSGCSGVVVEYRTRNREVAGTTHTQSTASNLEQVANLLCAQANSASYPQLDGKWVVATDTGWRPSVADWGDGVSASCTVDPIVR